MSDYIIGRNAIIEFLKTKDGGHKLFIQRGDLKGSVHKIVGMAKDKKIIIVEADRKKLDEMAQGGNHQGVILLTDNYQYSTLNAILKAGEEAENDPLIIILDEITDPHNLGAIIRTAEAAGANGVIIPNRRSSTVNHTVHKTSAGATSYMRVCKVTNIVQTIERLKKEGYWVYGADGRAEKAYTEIDYSGKVCLVIGNEGRGISQSVKKHCDVLSYIPMYGKTESLNASTSAAIYIYEILRSRNAHK